MAPLGALDGKWLSQQTTGSACAGDFLTVLDFGHPTRKFNRGHASPLDDYAMTLFGYRDDWRTYREIEQLAETYLDAWIAAVSPSCPPGPRLHLVLGTSNFAECQQSVGPCDVATAGQYWDVVVHDVMDYVAGKGYDRQVTAVWVGDDVETSWDPWPTTARFLNAVAQQESTYSAHARMVNYGDANTGVCSVVTGGCRAPWTAENVYDASWGLPWASPLPEVYSSDTAQRWDAIAQAYPAMQFLGIMTECAGMDPLPADGCQPDHGADPSSGPQSSTCEWAPATAYQYMQANDPLRPLTYATNIQWPHHTDGDQAGTQPGATACALDQPPSNRGQSPS
jgi:hypothetical protein